MSTACASLNSRHLQQTPKRLPLRGPINMLADFQCRSCESRNGDLVLDLGEQPLVNNILAPEDLAKPGFFAFAKGFRCKCEL